MPNYSTQKAKINIQIVYVPFQVEKVDNCVEKVYNFTLNPLILWDFECGKLYFAKKEYT